MLGAFGRSTLLAGRHFAQPRYLSHFSPYPASEERSTSEERFSDDFDVVIVGGGPSGLSAAIRLKQLAGDKDLRVALVEKGASIGAHILSGAVMQPNALSELIPDWKDKGAPVSVEAKEDYLFYFTEKGKFTIPTWGTPLQNHGNYLISLGQLCAWLGEQAEEMGVEVYPSIAGTEVLYEGEGADEKVVGIATGDSGIGKDGKRTPMFTEGMELRAKCTIFAEGCRGSLTKQLSERLNLRADCQDPAFGIGLKELWEIPPEKHREGLVMHSMGWPAPSEIYGGSFMYHQANNKVAIGYVVGLDYKNPYYNPYKMFQQFKHHPYIADFLEGGTCLKYGARALSEGGLQSLPKLHFPGGALIGDTAGFFECYED
uniref:Electron transfer flavoprotein-ubiquinone oxidoreductase n=1 Tax=Paramoeba aestuarina TaxID=180227 RepID=A0A7S4KET7_9EUKA|mmetsp:Transcript_18006/g.28174  ORF Transcript_18006/g.28174 Transcript_18006/m.28174 type:complete len:372 (+) Transcript_18006:34-1149(+)